MSNTDFNDMAALHGKDAVGRNIAGAMAALGALHQPDTDNAMVAIVAGQVCADTQTDESETPLIISGVSEVSGVQVYNDGLFGDTPADTCGVSEVSATTASKIPGTNDRPCFRVFDDRLETGGRTDSCLTPRARTKIPPSLDRAG